MFYRCVLKVAIAVFMSVTMMWVFLIVIFLLMCVVFVIVWMVVRDCI